ncbi:MAG: class I adenylate-forming enzyme family protein [Thermomicrobiales bacterium]
MSGNVSLPDSVQTIPDALAFWADRTPDAPAFILAGGPVVTYGALWRHARLLAETLAARGIARHDRIVLLVPEGPQLAIALLGTAAATIAVPLNATLTVPELDEAVQRLSPAGVVAAPSLPEASRGALSRNRVPLFELSLDANLGEFTLAGEAIRPPLRAVGPRPQDIAFIGHTSGTTGVPKQIPRIHRQIVVSGRIHRDRFGLSQRDRALSVAPITLALGRTGLTHGIAAGAALIFPALPGLPGLHAAIEAERPTWMHAAAGFLEVLTRYLRNHPLSQPSSFRFSRVTAAPIAPEIVDELAMRLGAPILPGYSMSETGLIATALPPPAPYKPGSTGKPMEEIRIVDEDGKDVGQGVAGEVWVGGPRIASRFSQDSELNALALTSPGWFRTGDVGYLDEDGFLFLTGRLNELINRGGAKIAPIEVDEVLLAHPAVAAAAAFAVADELLGEDIVAAVVVNDGTAVTHRELRRWMLDRLSLVKVPRRIWFVDDLPRTQSGKVQRGVLRERYEGDRVMG